MALLTLYRRCTGYVLMHDADPSAEHIAAGELQRKYSIGVAGIVVVPAVAMPVVVPAVGAAVGATEVTVKKTVGKRGGSGNELYSSKNGCFTDDAKLPANSCSYNGTSTYMVSSFTMRNEQAISLKYTVLTIPVVPFTENGGKLFVSRCTVTVDLTPTERDPCPSIGDTIVSWGKDE